MQHCSLNDSIISYFYTYNYSEYDGYVCVYLSVFVCVCNWSVCHECVCVCVCICTLVSLFLYSLCVCSCVFVCIRDCVNDSASLPV